MKAMKIIVIVALSCIVAGLIIFLAAFATVGFDITALQIEPAYTENHYTSESTITTLLVNDDSADIRLTHSSDDAFHITYPENSKRTYAITEETGTLSVNVKDNRHWFDYLFNISFTNLKVTIAVPDSFYGDLKVELSSGSIDVGTIHATDVKLEADSGKISLSDAVITGSLRVEVDSGDITLRALAVTGGITAEADSGNLTVRDAVAQENITLSTSSGEMTLINDEAIGNFSAESASGDIDFSMIRAGDDLTLRARSGEIEGTLPGRETDYSYRFETGSGNCNLPAYRNGGAHFFSAKTSSGDINISFADGQ